MEKSSLKPYFVIIGLLLATIGALAVSVDVRVTDEAGIRLALPDKVGDWTGRDLRYCLNPTCQREIVLTAGIAPAVCPTCGGGIDNMSLAEKNLLPLDTVILKKRYMRASGSMVHCTIVLSGKDRASIHRPEVCLVGQGRKIVDDFLVSVPITDRPALDVKVLDLIFTPPAVGDTPPPRIAAYYAYWFVGKDRETPHHWQRMVWMGMDRVFRNVAHKWAYISVGGGRDRDNIAYKAEIEDFVRELYPQIVLF